MKTRGCNFNMVTIILFSILCGLSCSTDSDLLVDAVLSDNIADEGIVVDDYFVIQNNESIILHVLSNDGFSPSTNVQIIEISSPTYGTVEINDDNISITYTPEVLAEEATAIALETQDGDEETQNEEETEELIETQDQEEEIQNEEETEEVVEAQDEEETATVEDLEGEDDSPNEEIIDTFTYTTEVVNDDETTSIVIGTVEVLIDSSTEDETTTEGEGGSTNSSNDDSEEEQEDATAEDLQGHSANLLFSSGFEGVSLSDPDYGYQYLSGTDKVTGFTWPMKVLGSDFSGIHRVNDGGGGAIENRIENTTGPNGAETSALFQQVNYNVQVTQTPYQINNIKENPKELYMSYWMKTDDTAVKGIDKWRAIWEYKTDNYASNKNGFRMIAFMATDYKGRPYWLFQGDTSPQNPIWQAENYDIPLIMNEWFKVEYYIKWSSGPDGYASMKVNGQLIGEHTGATTSNADDMDFIMLTQVYGNSHPMHHWVDDIEIWDGLPN